MAGAEGKLLRVTVIFVIAERFRPWLTPQSFSDTRTYGSDQSGVRSLLEGGLPRRKQVCRMREGLAISKLPDGEIGRESMD